MENQGTEAIGSEVVRDKEKRKISEAAEDESKSKFEYSSYVNRGQRKDMKTFL